LIVQWHGTYGHGVQQDILVAVGLLICIVTVAIESPVHRAWYWWRVGYAMSNYGDRAETK